MEQTINNNQELKKEPTAEEKLSKLLLLVDEKTSSKILELINILIRQAEQLAIENYKLKEARQEEREMEKQISKEVVKDLLRF